MALIPSGRRDLSTTGQTTPTRPSSETREAALASIRQLARPEPAAAPQAKAKPRRRGIGPIATAITESEIAQQIKRMARFWAADEIDPDAPRGSYLNFLV